MTEKKEDREEMEGGIVQYFGLILVLGLWARICEGDQTSGEMRGPVFINEPPSTIIFASDEGAMINCSAHGSPAPEMDWTGPDGQSKDNIEGYLHIFPNNSLHFPKFTGDLQNHIHHGSYRCTAKNNAGRIISRAVQVKAVKSDSYKQYNVQIYDRIVMRGNTAVLKCAVNPAYVKEYVVVTAWIQGSSVVHQDDRFSIFESTLHIRNVRDIDGYKNYKCMTYNKLTKQEKVSHLATLTVVAPANVEPNVEDSRDEITIDEGQTVQMPCVASGFPEPTYQWTKDGQTVLPQDRIQYVWGNLEIKNAGISDSGEYRCLITNPLGSKTITTTVTVKKKISAFISPATQTVDAEGTAVLNCTVSGHPVDRVDGIKWFKNGSPLVETSRVVLETPASLRIHDVIRQDKGMYQCMVSNQYDNVQSTAQLSLGAAKPVFTHVFGDKYVQPGPQVSLKCVAYGNPTPTITWKLDGSAMPRNARFSVGSFVTEAGDVVSHVNITGVKVEDGGRYECVANNDVGKLSHMAIINVYGVPYIRPMPNITAVASQPLAIRCSVSGYPIASITWTKDGTVLRTDHRVTVKAGGELTILSVQRSHDEGVYRCSAYNNNNEGMSRDVHVHVMEPPVIQPFSFSHKLKQGDRVSIPCLVSSGDLPITITWLKDGQPLPLDLGFQTTKNNAYTSTLSTQDAIPRQNGNYTCVASNQAATYNYTAMMHVDVPPRWVLAPQDSFVVLGRRVLLHCSTAGTPDPVVTWKKPQGSDQGNYQPVDLSDPRLSQFPNGTLQITNAKQSDDSSYLCHSYNGIGTISRAIFLTVHIPANFNMHQANYTVTKGHNTTVDCRAVGDTPMQISWRYRNQPLQQTSRYKTAEYRFENGYGSRLTIGTSVRSDTGYYMCTAKNDFGFDQLLIQLIVQETPDRPKNIAIEQSTSRSIKVSWTTPFNGHSDITHFIIQYKNSTDAWQGVIKNITVVSGTATQATIPSLHPSRDYDIRILARNIIGTSNPSLPISVATGEEAPSGAPTNVKVHAEDSQVIKISWSPPETSKQNGAILGYYVHYKIHNSSSPWRHSTVIMGPDVKLELTLENLEKFTKYSVQIQAYNMKGSGPQSEAVNVLTLEDVPSLPPTSVVASPRGSQGITVSWSPPPLFTLNGILQGYKVIVKPVRDDEDESDSHIRTTNGLTIFIQNLQKYTNYSVQVLAYTRKGEGVRSAPIYVMTEQDVPGQPSDVKSFAANSSTILLTWRPPHHPNGEITEYIIYQSSESTPTTDPLKFSVTPTITKFYATGLTKNTQYSFQVSAKTIVGEGEKTRIVKSSPLEQVAARIATFPHKILIQWKHDVILPCDSIGDPKPVVSWTKSHFKTSVSLPNSDNIRVMTNGSLLMMNVQSSDAANYTCRASNTHGADEIVITLVVQVPPNPPKLSVAVTTSTTIQVNWRSGSNGGSIIRGFTVFYKKEYDQNWKSTSVGHTNRTLAMTDLSCGTRYKFKMNARNSEGPSIFSETITAKTNGSTPIAPAQSLILTKINSTYITLGLYTWQTGGCPITGFAIKYKVFGDTTWITVSNNIASSHRTFVVEDLHPATWYVMQVTAENEAGQTDIELKFATLTYEGSTIQPIHLVKTKEIPFYEQIYIIVPLCAGFIIVICTSLAVVLYCKRRREELKNKEVTYNLRRDITAETSLMNDLDKRVNTDFEDELNPENIRNVNLLIQLEPDNLQMSHDGNSSSWMFNHSHSENSFPGMDDNADNENRKNAENGPQLTTFHSDIHKHMSDDSIAAEKAEARQKMMTFKLNDFPPPPPELLSEDTACQTNLAFHHSVPRRVRFKDIPEAMSDTEVVTSLPRRKSLLERLELLDIKRPASQNDDLISKKMKWQEGVILSPSKYASAEHIHSIFYGSMRLPTPTALAFIPKTRIYSRPGSAAERGSHRASTLSSITTVSSSREELLQAYENARYNPNPEAEFMEIPKNGSSTSHTSQPTDCSESTEPGIRQFTQAPPRPEECRQSSCEVPMYEEAFVAEALSKRPTNIKLTPIHTSPAPPPPPPPNQRRKSPHRRTKGRRPRNRGAVIGKKVIRAPRQAPRSYSRNSTVSTNSEDIYSVDERTYESPSEGYVSHQHDSYVYTDSEYDPYSYRPRSRSRYQHQTTPYPPAGDSPETPGCDERKPLVSALARTALASPNEEEEETSLLDRYYRPVLENESSQSSGDLILHLGDNNEGHYTDNYTVV